MLKLLLLLSSIEKARVNGPLMMMFVIAKLMTDDHRCTN